MTQLPSFTNKKLLYYDGVDSLHSGKKQVANVGKYLSSIDIKWSVLEGQQINQKDDFAKKITNIDHHDYGSSLTLNKAFTRVK